MISRPCPICSAPESSLLFENKMVSIGQFDMSYEVHRCDRCNFHFAGKLPPISQYIAYYREASKYDVLTKVAPLDQIRIAEAVRFVNEWISERTYALDLGCGSGAFLASMRDAGWSAVAGLDPAPNAAAKAKELFDLSSVYAGDLRHLDDHVDISTADLVCLMAVLEHLPEFRGDLEGLIEKMRPGACLLLEVPAIERFSHTKGEPFGEFSIEHIQYFSKASVRNLMNRLDLSIVAEHYQELPSAGTGSIFVIARRDSSASGTSRLSEFSKEPTASFDEYIKISESLLKAAIDRLPLDSFILYGAGSHSARLIPRLSAKIRNNIVAIVDSNINLSGKRFGQWDVRSPDLLSTMPDVPIVISSFRSQSEIRNMLSTKVTNPLILLYE